MRSLLRRLARRLVSASPAFVAGFLAGVRYADRHPVNR